MKSTLLRLAAAGLLSVSASAALAQDAPKPETVNVTILAAGDMDSFDTGVNGPRGGFARLNALAKAEKAANPNMLYLYSGDLISPSLLSGIDHGANTIDLVNLVPFDVAVPGNHEFDFGPEVFMDRAMQSVFPWTAVNIRGADGGFVEGLGHEPVIKEIGGVKFGIVPVATDETPVLATPGDWTWENTVDSALAGADWAAEQGADIVIALVHAAHAQDEAMYDSGKFDLVLSGHDHDYRIHYNDIVGYVETSNDANLLTAIDLAIEVTPENGDTKRSVTWRPNFRFIDTASVTPDPDTSAKVDEFAQQLDTELNVEIGSTSVPISSKRAVVRGEESAMGNLIADATRAKNGADVSITNGGGIRGDTEYAAGHVFTRKDIFTELPFGNVTTVTEITGADLLAALENGFSQIEAGAGRFPQVSGLTVEVDATKPAGSRVTSVLVNGNALDPAIKYKVATNDFMMAGGDGYTALSNGTVLIDKSAGSLMASDVIDYITGLKTVAPAVEGRIVIKK
jgi:2',3'-cyclic-nucleotide 2'-phosphodiesterase (5'-nucleotidase family)